MSETNNPEQNPQFSQHFIDTVGAVNQYNAEHAGIAGSVKGIVGMLFGQAGIKEPAVSAVEEAHMAKEMVQFLNTDALDEMGVRLAEIHSSGVRQIGHEELGKAKDGEASTLFLVITDGDKFADTLVNLKPAPEQKDAVDKSVDSVLSRTVSIVQQAFGNSPEQEHDENLRRFGEDQLSMFQDTLTPALAQGGFTELPSYQKLSEYAARSAAGTLDDYRGAERLGLLETGFGPATWQRDATPEYLDRRWNEAFAYLKQLREKEQPTEYYTELFNRLRGDFDKAQAWLNSDTGYPDDYMSKLKPKMAELSKIWDEQFALENGMYSSESEPS